jgi:hypothetical protein
MSARVDQDAQASLGANQLALPGTGAPLALAAIDYDDRWGGHTLPSDHPPWMKDTLSVSQRARALIAKLRPVVIKVIAAFEHHVRSIVVGKGRLSVDPSGSYRLD